MLAGLGQAVVLRNMRGDVHLAQRRNVIAGVVGFVLADRDSSSRSFGFLLEHRLRGTPLGGAAGLCDGAVNSKTVAVLHDRMTHIAELGLAPGRLAIELGLWVACALMRVVLAPLAVKVRAVAVIRAVLGLEALVRGPGLDERAVDREMLVRQQRLDLWVIQKPFHELPEHIAALKPIAVFGEGGRIPDRIGCNVLEGFVCHQIPASTLSVFMKLSALALS